MPAGFDDVRLRTARLLLRPLQPTDAKALFAIQSDPAVMRYWSSPPWTGIDQAIAMIDGDLHAMAAGRHLRLAIERTDSGELIGQCTLFKLDVQCRSAEIGYSMSAAHWGRGFMHEALTALLNHGFDALPLNRIEADIDPRNQASARSLERLGFQREGLLRERWIVGEEVSDSLIFGLLQREWTSREADTRRLARNRSMPEATVIPVLAYPDVAQAVDWLCRAFGFTERLQIGSHRAQLNVGGGAVVITGGSTDAPVQPQSVMVRVTDVDAHHARAAREGARVTSTPVDQPYGERQYTALDLWQRAWTFSQTIADVDPAAWGGVRR